VSYILGFSDKPTKEVKRTMTSDSPLKDKVILAVDDESDILEIVEEELDMCLVHKASDYDTAV